jgi:hypothetical protein
VSVGGGLFDRANPLSFSCQISTNTCTSLHDVFDPSNSTLLPSLPTLQVFLPTKLAGSFALFFLVHFLTSSTGIALAYFVSAVSPNIVRGVERNITCSCGHTNPYVIGRVAHPSRPCPLPRPLHGVPDISILPFPCSRTWQTLLFLHIVSPYCSLRAILYALQTCQVRSLVHNIGAAL